MGETAYVVALNSGLLREHLKEEEQARVELLEEFRHLMGTTLDPYDLESAFVSSVTPKLEPRPSGPTTTIRPPSWKADARSEGE